MLNEHSKMLANIMKDIEIMKADLSTIKFDLQRKVSWDEFIRLEKKSNCFRKKNKIILGP